MRCSAARMKNKNSLIFRVLPVNQARTRLKPKSPARLCRRHSSAKASEGILKGAKGPLEPALLPTFLQEQKSRGPRAACEVPRRVSASKDKIKNLRKRKEDKQSFRKKSTRGRLAPPKKESVSGSLPPWLRIEPVHRLFGVAGDNQRNRLHRVGNRFLERLVFRVRKAA